MQHTLRDVTHPSNNPFFFERVEKMCCSKLRRHLECWRTQCVRQFACVALWLTRSFKNMLNLDAGRDDFVLRKINLGNISGFADKFQ